MKAMSQTLILVTALGIPTGARAQKDSSTFVRDRAGCYALRLGRWSGPLPTNSPEAHTPPSRFRLDTVAVQTRPRSRFAVEPDQLVPGRMVASWIPMSKDSISMFWSTGFIGVRLRFVARGDSLVGVATAFRDAHAPGDPPDPSASVIATRINCALRTGQARGDTLFVSDRYIGKEVAGAEITAKFDASDARTTMLRLDAPVATINGRRWVLGDILVALSVNGNGFVAVWTVAGRKDVIEAYLAEFRSIVRTRHPIYDFGIRSLIVRCACD